MAPGVGDGTWSLLWLRPCDKGSTPGQGSFGMPQTKHNNNNNKNPLSSKLNSGTVGQRLQGLHLTVTCAFVQVEHLLARREIE